MAGDNDPTPTTSATGASVAHVAVRVPPFWDSNPTLWFAQLESQFELAHITADSTKYGYVISNLSERQMLEVQDIVSAPAAANKYGTIKAALIERLSLSKGKQLTQLLHNEELGDRTPSQLLRRMMSLGDGSVTDEVLKNIWMSRLPADTQKILTVSSGNLEALARVADQLHELHPSTSHASVLEKRVEELTLQLHAYTSSSKHGREEERSRSRTRARSHSRGRNRSSSKPGTCWYHRRFGDKARGCEEPCNYKAGNGKGSQ